MKINEVIGGYLVSGDNYQDARGRKAATVIAILKQETSLCGADVLDVGCGSGLLLASLKSLIPDLGRVVGSI